MNRQYTFARSLSVLFVWIIIAPFCWCQLNGSRLNGTLHETIVAASRQPLVANCTYKLWIPQNTPVVRTIFVINMRGAGKRIFFTDAEWRAMAARNSAAMMYCEFEAKSVRGNGYGLSILKACDQFAIELDRPELKHTPFVLWGHSMGGRVAQDFVRFRPRRVLAFHIALRAFATPDELMEEEPTAKRVPGLYLMGANDKKPNDIREHFVKARRERSPRAWVWLPEQSHWPKGMSFTKDDTTLADWRAWAAHDVVIPWTEAMIQLRMPSGLDPSAGPVDLRRIDTQRGWLADIQTGQIAAADTFSANPFDASWFPNRELATAWVRFSMPTSKPASR